MSPPEERMARAKAAMTGAAKAILHGLPLATVMAQEALEDLAAAWTAPTDEIPSAAPTADWMRRWLEPL